MTITERTKTLEKIRNYKEEHNIGLTLRDIFKYPEGSDSPAITHYQHRLIVGKAANLIGSMSRRGATEEELERAIKYSIVAIDAMKYHLDYKRAYEELGIPALVNKYMEVKFK